MKHFATPRFWQLFEKLPETTQVIARRNFELLKQNPQHPSLQLKRIKPKNYWSVRVGIHYRALGVNVAEGIQWAWIGSHAEYDKLVAN